MPFSEHLTDRFRFISCVKQRLNHFGIRYFHATNYALSTLDVNIRSPQRIRLNKLAPWLNLTAHQRGEHVVGPDRVVDLRPQQALQIMGV